MEEMCAIEGCSNEVLYTIEALDHVPIDCAAVFVHVPICNDCMLELMEGSGEKLNLSNGWISK
jgi:hypothetical protein